MRGTKESAARTRLASPRVLIVPALVAFMAVDIILVALALGWGRDEPQVGGSDLPSRSATSVGEDDGVTDDHVAPPSSADEALNSLETAPRLLSASSDTVAWRSEGGACADGAPLELTIDGGENWAAASPTSDDLGRPLWVSGADDAAVQSAVASGAECEPKGLRTFDSGSSWTEDRQVVTNSVLVNPMDTGELIWAGETFRGPCRDMTQVAVTGGVASVVCGDRSLWMASSGVSRWAQTSVENVIAVGGSEGRWVAAVDSAVCEGLGIVEFDRASGDTVACAPISAEEGPALDLLGDTLWLWAEDQVLVSADFGRSFN